MGKIPLTKRPFALRSRLFFRYAPELRGYTPLQIFPPNEQKINAAISHATIVEPTGVPAKIEIINPEREHKTEITAEQIVTDLKLL